MVPRLFFLRREESRCRRVRLARQRLRGWEGDSRPEPCLRLVALQVPAGEALEEKGNTVRGRLGDDVSSSTRLYGSIPFRGMVVIRPEKRLEDSWIVRGDCVLGEGH